MTEARRVLGDLPGLDFAVSAAATLQGADALLVITEWKEFKSPDFDGLVVALKQAVVFVQTMGIEYHGVGRGVPVGS